jgi:hypothetical protein
MSEFKLPTEQIELPSKGYLYSPESELSKGVIEMKYMTAKEEDILTNQSYIEKGIVLDKLMKSLIISPINYDDLLICDKDAIMVAARVMGYGKNYTFDYKDEEQIIDLTQLENKPFDENLFKSSNNQFEFTLPQSGNVVTFKMLTHKDEQDIDREVQGLKKINKNEDRSISTRLKYILTSINGLTEKKDIRNFVDNALLAQDSRALRAYIKKMSPGVDLTFFPDGSTDRVSIPIGLSFFWPDFEDRT